MGAGTRSRKLFAWVAGLGLAVAPAVAQAQPAAAVEKIYTRNTSFKLPVLVDDAARERIAQIKFYVKGPAGAWVCHESAPPTQGAFSFRADADGEYRFTFATVDRAGKQSPADLDAVPPHRVVVVDTVPPTVTVVPVTAGRTAALHCDLRDTNPDSASLKLSYRAPAGTWKALEPVPGEPGTFRLPGSLADGKVRVTAADRAGNVSTKEWTAAAIRDAAKASPYLPNTPDGASARADGGKLPPRSAWPKPPLISEPLLDEPGPIAASPVVPAGLTLPPAPPTATPAAAKDDLFQLPPLPPGPPSPGQLPDSVTKGVPEPTRTAEKVSPPTPPPGGPTLAVTLLSTTRCSLEYSLEGVQPASLGRVEFWATRDGGKSWKRVMDESRGHSPAQLVLPGEGSWGILIRTGGAGSQPPTAADKPDCWVEVDLTRPSVNLLPPTVGTGADAGTLQILWTAQDKNLAPESINLWYAQRPDGPWQPIVTGHKNEGVYRWTLPTGVGPQLYLRLEASDRAGNVGRAESRQPVSLDPRPRVHVLTVAPRP